MTTLFILLASALILNAGIPSLVLNKFFKKRWTAGDIGLGFNLVPLVQLACIVGGELLLAQYASLYCALGINGVVLWLATGAGDFVEVVLSKIFPIRPF